MMILKKKIKIINIICMFVRNKKYKMKKTLFFIIIGLILKSCDVDIQTGGCMSHMLQLTSLLLIMMMEVVFIHVMIHMLLNYGVLAPIEICDYQADVVFEDVAAANLL